MSTTVALCQNEQDKPSEQDETCLGKSSVKCILIVEDDRDICSALVQLLTSEGFDVITAHNGQEALNILMAGARPHLIMLDLMMPIMDGYTFREEQLKNSDISSIPVIIMTADGQAQDKISKISCRHYIRKPFDVDDLLGLINTTLDSNV